MNIENIVTKIRDLISIDAYTPDLPQNKEDICCVRLETGRRSF